MKAFTLGFLTLCAGAVSVCTSARAATPQGPLMLKGGTVYTVSSGVLPETDLLIMDGRIAEIGTGLAVPPGAKVIEVTGRRVYPGLIAADSTLGLEEIGLVRQSVDSAELGAINPNARVQIAINPDSERIPVTRSNGVLSALVVPRPSFDARPGLIAGTSALIRLDGWTGEDLTLRSAVALHLYWPSMKLDRVARSNGNTMNQKKEIAAQIKAIEDAFNSARAYQRSKKHGARQIDVDLRWEAMLPALQGLLPVFIHANEEQQIRAALDWSRGTELRVVLVGGREAWRVSDQLTESQIPVILTETSQLPGQRDDAYDAVFTTPARLYAAGVRFCIAVSSWTSARGNDRNLAYDAALAAAFGLPPDEALKAITLYPAQILGVAAELGSIETGKRATLIVTDGDPLEVTTQFKLAFIDGAQIDLTNRQTELYEKYRLRPTH